MTDQARIDIHLAFLSAISLIHSVLIVLLAFAI